MSTSGQPSKDLAVNNLLVKDLLVVNKRLVTNDLSTQTLTTSKLNVNDSLDIGGPVTLLGDLDVLGKSTFVGPATTNELNVLGNTSMAGTLNVVGNTILAGTLGVTGDVSLSSKLTVTGDTKLAKLDTTGNALLGGTLGVTGDISTSGLISSSATGIVTRTLTDAEILSLTSSASSYITLVPAVATKTFIVKSVCLKLNNPLGTGYVGGSGLIISNQALLVQVPLSNPLLTSAITNGILLPVTQILNNTANNAQGQPIIVGVSGASFTGSVPGKNLQLIVEYYIF